MWLPGSQPAGSGQGSTSGFPDDLNEKSNVTAAGYLHTLYNTRGLDIRALMSFPFDGSIANIATYAYQQCEALLAVCGIPASLLRHTSSSNATLNLPSIGEWLPESNKTGESSNESESFDFDFGDDSDELACTLTAEQKGLAVELHELIQAEESGHRGLGTCELDDQMEAFTAAGIALMVETQNQIDLLPDANMPELLKQSKSNIAEIVNLAPLVIADEIDYKKLQTAQGLSMQDLSPLVALRKAHETEFSRKSTRKGAEAGISQPKAIGKLDEELQSTRLELVRKMRAVLRDHNDEQRVGTGAVRRLHYGGIARAGTDEKSMKGGNAQNAALAAKERSSKALLERIKRLKESGVVLPTIAQAAVTPLTPITMGSWGIALYESKLWLIQVVTMYAKGAGKAGRHAWTESEGSISNLSYVGVQLWDHFHHNIFRSITPQTSHLGVNRFAHLAWTNILHIHLRTTGKQPKLIEGEKLLIPESLYQNWIEIGAVLPQIQLALKARRPRRERKDSSDEDDTLALKA